MKPVLSEVALSNKLINDITDMILKNKSKSAFMRRYPLKRKGTKDLVTRIARSALKCGAFDYSYSGSKLVAYLLVTNAEFAPGLRSSFGAINTDGSKKGRNWIGEKLKELDFMFDSKTQFALPYALRDLLPTMNRAGFKLETIKLMGSPKECLNLFDDGSDPAATFYSHGLTLSHANKKDLVAVKAIEKREFSRNPQYGWFVANEHWLKHMLEVRLGSLTCENRVCYVLKNKRGTVKGYFGLWTHPTPNHGRLAGPELIFDQSLQGKGLSRPAYQVLLRDMVKMKAQVFEGNTAQAGVLKQAKNMGRVPTDLFLRYGGGYFNEHHFLKYF